MILITGGSGQLGTSLRRALRGCEVLAPPHTELDITETEQVAAFFREKKPDAVVHCAAFNAVDAAEEEPALCCRTNIVGTRLLAQECRRTGAYLLSVSSDFVFDGRKTGAYEIGDAKNPLSVYGHSKSVAEDLVLQSDARNTVLRISWLFGRSRTNFVEAILQAAERQPVLEVVDDQVGCPTYAEDLAPLLLELLRLRPAGVLHATNEGSCSRAAFAEEILRQSGARASVRAVSSADYPAKARRPRNSVLSKTCLDAAGLRRLPPWRDALARYLKARKEPDWIWR